MDRDISNTKLFKGLYEAKDDRLPKGGGESFNPLNPNTKIDILIYCPYTFSTKVVGRICWIIKEFDSSSLIMHSILMTTLFLKHWYNKEKFHNDHSQGLKG